MKMIYCTPSIARIVVLARSSKLDAPLPNDVIQFKFKLVEIILF